MNKQDYYNDFFEIGQQKINFSFFELSLPDDDPVYTLKKVMEELDFSGLLAHYSDKGRTGYNPIMMYAVVTYANMQGVRAVDRIVKLCERDMEYKGDVTVKVDALAASAASVIAMAGTTVLMSPVAMMMIHNPITVAIGDSKEMQKAGEMLNEVKEGIMNAYEIKTGMDRKKISHLMDAESWFNAKKAVELGFADGILHEGEGTEESGDMAMEGMMFSRTAVTNSLLTKLIPKKPEAKVPIEQLEKRLQLLSH